MEIAASEISIQLFRFLNKIIFLEKKNIFEHKSVKLYPSEIHLLLSIEDRQSTSATRMANKLGISKSAVSQTISRLEKKGVIFKDKDPYNKNELILSFTPFGEKALKDYKQHQAANWLRFDQYLQSRSKNDREVIYQFLVTMEGVIDRLK